MFGLLFSRRKSCSWENERGAGLPLGRGARRRALAPASTMLPSRYFSSSLRLASEDCGFGWPAPCRTWVLGSSTFRCSLSNQLTVFLQPVGASLFAAFAATHTGWSRSGNRNQDRQWSVHPSPEFIYHVPRNSLVTRSHENRSHERQPEQLRESLRNPEILLGNRKHQ
jgi:hypothetical protein